MLHSANGQLERPLVLKNVAEISEECLEYIDWLLYMLQVGKPHLIFPSGAGSGEFLIASCQ